MSVERQWWPAVAVAAFAAITLLTLARPVLIVLADEPLSPSNLGGFVLYAFPVVGVLVALHRPGNAIAWLCLVIGMIWALEGALWGGALYGMHHDWDATVSGMLAALGDSFVMPGLFLMATLVLLLFPNGRLPSPGWRWLAKLSVVCVVGAYVLSLFSSEPWGWGRPPYDNPLSFDSTPYDLALFTVAMSGFVAVAASIASLIRRYRRSTGIERLQLKWLVAAGALAVLGWFATIVLIELRAIDEGIAVAVSVCVFMLFPVSIGLAILRYRLYDIDRLISRTLTYGFLTGGLAATYFGLVVGLQAGFRSFAGGSDLAIVLTTLVVAAMFLPARRYVQDTVDRRFNRRSYDATRTIEGFGARLRQEVDIDTLQHELLAVVDETMQPAQASLWLTPRERGA